MRESLIAKTYYHNICFNAHQQFGLASERVNDTLLPLIFGEFPNYLDRVTTVCQQETTPSAQLFENPTHQPTSQEAAASRRLNHVSTEAWHRWTCINRGLAPAARPQPTSQEAAASRRLNHVSTEAWHRWTCINRGLAPAAAHQLASTGASTGVWHPRPRAGGSSSTGVWHRRTSTGVWHRRTAPAVPPPP